MYKVVIIDDEPKIVEGLTKTIHWEKWNCKVVGSAYDGHEGLELIRKERPNIIITDINMPRLNGLNMVAGIRSQFPDVQITILTGFRDFDYAQEAIHLGVNRFLLKPSKMDQLQEAIEYMTNSLQAKGILPEETVEVRQQEKAVDISDDALYQNAASSFIVKNAIAYIEEHYAEKIRLIDVADEIYVSQWHLSKLLNKHAGQNFSEILNGIRIEKAKELLMDPAKRIGMIAEEV